MKEINWGGIEIGDLVGEGRWPITHIRLEGLGCTVTFKRGGLPGDYVTMYADDMEALGVKLYRPAPMPPMAEGAVIRLPDGRLYVRAGGDSIPWCGVGRSYDAPWLADEEVQKAGFEVLFEGVAE